MKARFVALTSLLVATSTISANASAGQTTLAPLYSASQWINGRVTSSDLAGRVVVMDIFTVDCSNCQNVVPNLRSLNAKDRARGLRIVGIHAPETPAERGARTSSKAWRGKASSGPLRSTTTSISGRPTAPMPGRRNSSSIGTAGCVRSSWATCKTTKSARPWNRYSAKTETASGSSS